jgi:hypothetical protein
MWCLCAVCNTITLCAQMLVLPDDVGQSPDFTEAIGHRVAGCVCVLTCMRRVCADVRCVASIARNAFSWRTPCSARGCN